MEIPWKYHGKLVKKIFPLCSVKLFGRNWGDQYLLAITWTQQLSGDQLSARHSPDAQDSDNRTNVLVKPHQQQMSENDKILG